MMTEKNSLICFEQLATEIIFEIFDYLSCNDIIYTFFNLNERFNSILLEHKQYLNKFQTPITNFYFWQRILPIISLQIEYLTITTIDFSFSLNLFPNLKSVIISSPIPIYSSKLISILENEQFQKLTTFKIQNQIKEDNYSYGGTKILQKVFHDENSLQIFECSLPLCVDLYKLTINNQINTNVNIQTLSIKLPDIRCIMTLFEYAPNLKYLSLFLNTFYSYNKLNHNIDLEKIKLKKICLTYQNSRIKEQDFIFIINFIKQFSNSLIYLLLNLNYIETTKYQFDGFILQSQLLESMIQLKTFHLYAQLDQQEPNDVENLLSTFENQFWFDHQWSVGIHKNYLYTLPFYFNQPPDFIDFHHIKSSNPNILNSSKTWSRVTSIDLSNCTNMNFNLIKQIKLKMPNLTSIIFNCELMNNLYSSENQLNSIGITLDNINTVHCQGEYLQNMKQWFINILPNTKNLILSYNCQPAACSANRTVFLHKLNAYFHGEKTRKDYIYFSNIQYIEIKLIFEDIDDLYKHVLRLVRELLEMFKNLKSFIFQIHQNNKYNNSTPFTDLDKMIQLLNMDKISKKYQIKHIENYFQVIKMNNE